MKRAGFVVLRVVLGALFVYAGVLKLGDVAGFIEEISNYRLLTTLAPFLGTVLPTVEIVVGLALVAAPQTWRAPAALLVLGLLVTFTIAVTSAWLRHIDVACGCFGTGGGPVNALTVLRDVLLLACAAAVLARERRGEG
ncbi:MAG: MauE/DoxX family redox-associated membrane protein [Polyangia bacterium]